MIAFVSGSKLRDAPSLWVLQVQQHQCTQSKEARDDVQQILGCSRAVKQLQTVAVALAFCPESALEMAEKDKKRNRRDREGSTAALRLVL